MLQTRNGKRTAQAALKIACDLVDEGMRTEEEAVAMIDPRKDVYKRQADHHLGKQTAYLFSTG